MSHLMAIFAFLKAHWQYELPILLLVLNDVANSAKNYPKVDSFVLMLMDWLSVHQNADSPGTLKMPFKRSNKPSELQMPDKKEPAPMPTAAVLLPLAFLFAFNGCAYCQDMTHKSEAKCEVLSVLQQCGGPAVENLVLSVLSKVMLGLSTSNYQAALDSVTAELKASGVADAENVVTCAVQYATASLGAAPKASELQNSTTALIRANAKAYLLARKARSAK